MRGVITLARVSGLVLMVACAGAIGWMLTDDRFELDEPETQIELSYTDPVAVLTAAGLRQGEHPNVIRLRTDAMRAAILSFPSIADADVRVVLPDRVIVSATERSPVLAVSRPEATFLIDGDGMVLASVSEAEADALGLPRIDDERLSPPVVLAVGGSLDPLDQAAMFQLGALTPTEIGSSAQGLRLRVADEDGYVMSAEPAGWQAVFGTYTPTLRPVDLIPRQAQCLRSLLAEKEASIETIYLAPLDERCGTFVVHPTPRASATPEPTS